MEYLTETDMFLVVLWLAATCCVLLAAARWLRII
jgi:hypothetical protein